MSSTQQQSAVFVFDNPRTCSQLFNKLVASHPQLTNIFHPIIGASMYGPENVGQHLQKCEAALKAQDALTTATPLPDETYAKAVQRLMSLVYSRSQVVLPTIASNSIANKQFDGALCQDKIPWIKDHAFCVTKPDIIINYMHYSTNSTNIENPAAEEEERIVKNPTVLPDSFFFHPGLIPIILIRHPSSILPSYLRVQEPVFKFSIHDENLRAMISLHWCRLIFEAYRQAQKRTPVVLDADDLLHNPKGIMTSLCETLGLDPEGVKYDWEAVSKENWPKDLIMQGFFGDLLKSEGVVVGRRMASSGRLHLGDIMNEWGKEFGENVAREMERIVEGEMEDYEYLRAFRMQAD